MKSKKYCLNCGKEIFNFNTYCNNDCFKEYQYKQYIESWKNGIVDGGTGNWGSVSRHIRTYLFKKYDNKCCLCGWSEINPYTNKIPLEIDHIDGNAMNHREENLRLICPNCHSLTETYRGKNKGNGRGLTWIPSDTTKRNNVKKKNKIDIIKNCGHCGKEMHITKAKDVDKKFCCLECKYKGLKK